MMSSRGTNLLRSDRPTHPNRVLDASVSSDRRAQDAKNGDKLGRKTLGRSHSFVLMLVVARHRLGRVDWNCQVTDGMLDEAGFGRRKTSGTRIGHLTRVPTRT
jgi:hypothetical protein